MASSFATGGVTLTSEHQRHLGARRPGSRSVYGIHPELWLIPGREVRQEAIVVHSPGAVFPRTTGPLPLDPVLRRRPAVPRRAPLQHRRAVAPPPHGDVWDGARRLAVGRPGPASPAERGEPLRPAPHVQLGTPEAAFEEIPHPEDASPLRLVRGTQLPFQVGARRRGLLNLSHRGADLRGRDDRAPVLLLGFPEPHPQPHGQLDQLVILIQELGVVVPVVIHGVLSPFDAARRESNPGPREGRRGRTDLPRSTVRYEPAVVA